MRIHPTLPVARANSAPESTGTSLDCDIIALMNDHIKDTRVARQFVSAVLMVYLPFVPPRRRRSNFPPALSFIFPPHIPPPSFFRTISSGLSAGGKSPSYLQVPRTTTNTNTGAPSPTTAPRCAKIVLLNSICFLISLGHSFSVSSLRGEVRERERMS